MLLRCLDGTDDGGVVMSFWAFWLLSIIVWVGDGLSFSGYDMNMCVYNKLDRNA